MKEKVIFFRSQFRDYFRLVFSRISVNSLLTPLRSDVRSEIVLYACSKLVSVSCKRSIRVFSIAERRSESLFSTYCSSLYRSDNCRASFPSGAWPALFFLRVIALFFSILVVLLIYLNHLQLISVSVSHGSLYSLESGCHLCE